MEQENKELEMQNNSNNIFDNFVNGIEEHPKESGVGILGLLVALARVFIACVFVIQVIILLMVKGHHADHITLSFWEFFAKYKALLIYLAVINFIAFAAYAVDKVNAAEHRSRIRIVTLLGLAFIGGSIGSLLAMYLLRHKTRKDYFTVGVPLIIVMQVVIIFYMMNAGW